MEEYQNTIERIQIPDTVEGIRTRKTIDGGFFIPKSNKKAEAILNASFIRVPGYLKWYPKAEPGHEIEQLAPICGGKTIYIVGKGSSLDNIENMKFEDDGVIIALNEAIFKIEDVGLHKKYSVLASRVDITLVNIRFPVSPVLISPQNQYVYAGIEDKYICKPFTSREDMNKYTPISATRMIGILKQFDVKKLVMVCMDSCVNQDTKYARCIGHESTRGGDPSRYLAHKALIERAAFPIPLKWIHPNDLKSKPLKSTAPVSLKTIASDIQQR